MEDLADFAKARNGDRLFEALDGRSDGSIDRESVTKATFELLDGRAPRLSDSATTRRPRRGRQRVGDNGVGARRPPKLTRRNKKSGKTQGGPVSVSPAWRRNTVRIVQVFQGQSPVCPTQSEVWFSVRGTGALM